MPLKVDPEPDEDLEFDDLQDQFKDLATDIYDTLKLGRQARTDDSKVGLFHARISRIDSAFEKFTSIFNLLRTTCKKKKVVFDSYKDFKTKTQSYYYEALALAAPAPELSQSIASASNASIAPTASYIKLPQVQLTTFDGDISKWPTFKDTFQALIHTNPSLSGIQKYHYLRSSLNGAALQSIAIIPLTELEYPQAWETLLNRYNNRRLQATSHLTKILNYKPMSRMTLDSVQHLTETVIESTTAFKRLALEDEGGFILMTLILRLLPPQLRDRFEATIMDIKSVPTLKDVTDFIHRQSLNCQAESYATIPSSSPHQQEPKRVFYAKESATPTPVCPYCKQSHLLFKCPLFLQWLPTQRRAFTNSEKGICQNCLSATHSSTKCNSKYTCRICRGKHHTLIHLDQPSTPNQIMRQEAMQPVPLTATYDSSNGSHLTDQPATPAQGQEPNQSVFSTSAYGISDRSHIFLGTAQALVLARNGFWQRCRMLIDCGAQRSCITTELRERLGLEQHPSRYRLCGFGDAPIKGGDSQVSCTITPLTQDSTFVVDAAVVERISSHMPSEVIPTDLKDKFDHMHLADPTFCQPGPIDFLLGADLFPQILLGNVTPGPSGTPTALSTVFGWVIMGRIPSVAPYTLQRVLMTTDKVSQSLPRILERFWQIEEVSSNMKIDPKDVFCENHFIQTHKRDLSGRYIVRLPFHSPPPEFRNSRNNAVNRYYRLEHKLNKDKELQAEYSRILNEQLELDYITHASSAGRYFLPHHGVLKDSSTTKLRIVYDASATTVDGALNDYLCAGPKLQNDIRDVLLGFRLHPYAMTADIQKMFLQIIMHKEDRSFQHFIYRFDRSSSLQEFEIKRLSFGLSCSPFLAIRVIHQLITDEGLKFPEASRVLTDDVYIDDVLTSTRTLTAAMELQQELITLLDRGGFVLQKWSSNDANLLQGVPNENSGVVSLADMEDSVVKVLGLESRP